MFAMVHVAYLLLLIRMKEKGCFASWNTEQEWIMLIS